MVTFSESHMWQLKTGFAVFFQLGPEKGVIHLATAAIVNALWDLWAKMENKVELHVLLFI